MNQNLRQRNFIMLEQTFDMEDQLLRVLPQLAAATTNETLQNLLTDHLEETEQQYERLEKIFTHHRHSPTGLEYISFRTLMSETEDELETITDPQVKDAFIVATAGLVEHIEIGRYETHITWCRILEEQFAKDLLKKTLNEETSAMGALSKLQKGGLFTESVATETET